MRVSNCLLRRKAFQNSNSEKRCSRRVARTGRSDIMLASNMLSSPLEATPPKTRFGLGRVTEPVKSSPLTSYLSPGEERKERVELPDGTVEHYDGPAGEERMVRVESPDGKVDHYRGPRGAERKATTVFPNGLVWQHDDWWPSWSDGPDIEEEEEPPLVAAARRLHGPRGKPPPPFSFQ